VEPGTKLAMMRTRIDDDDEGTTDPNQIWVRERTTRSGSGCHARMGEARGGGQRRLEAAATQWLLGEE